MLQLMTEVPPFDPETAGPGYTYVHVADHIQRRIETGDLPRGAMLPAERALAAEYGVAVGTIRRATAELRDRGLIITLPGKGSYVASA